MKKLWTVLVSLLVVASSYGQTTVDDLFRQFGKNEEATSIHLGKVTMAFASLFAPTMGVNNIDVIDLEECPAGTSQKLHEAISSLDDPEFVTMVSSNEDEERTKVLVKMEKDYIKELVVLTSGNGDNTLVRLKGKIRPEDIQEVIEEHKGR